MSANIAVLCSMAKKEEDLVCKHGLCLVKFGILDALLELSQILF